MAAFAAQRGFRYEPDADERWMRAWEPFVTVKVAARYEHALQSTGEAGSITLARIVASLDVRWPDGTQRTQESAAWIAIVQDVRMDAVAAGTCDAGSAFAEPLDLVTMPRRPTGDPAFDRLFVTFAPTAESLARAVTPSLRKLVLGWRIPLHFELRKGGFILVPAAL
ncbi:MAG TPA: hypothetical protein VNO21_10130, partial [Polyangiaceae bacterium]|nr:hypothetical protein [Polyangiaceae bacterium]